MPQKETAVKFHIVCSDQPRTGKTLFSRLLSDYLILIGRPPLIFDFSHTSSGIRRYFPSRSYRAELSTTAGRMALFDRALTPPLKDCVVDLSSHLLTEFFKLMRHIGFGEVAHTPVIGVVVYFLVDGSVESLAAGRKLQDGYAHERFIVVTNEVDLPAVSGALTTLKFEVLARQGAVTVPVLPAAAMSTVMDSFFSFSRFAQYPPVTVPYAAREPIRSFLASVYQQFDVLGIDHLELDRGAQSMHFSRAARLR